MTFNQLFSVRDYSPRAEMRYDVQPFDSFCQGDGKEQPVCYIRNICLQFRNLNIPLCSVPNLASFLCSNGMYASETVCASHQDFCLSNSGICKNVDYDLQSFSSVREVARIVCSNTNSKNFGCNRCNQLSNQNQAPGSCNTLLVMSRACSATADVKRCNIAKYFCQFSMNADLVKLGQEFGVQRQVQQII